MVVWRWHTLFGYLLFIGMMAVGYYYNVTFIQLGLVDLGTRVIGMSEWSAAMSMAWLALLTGATALVFGVIMAWRGWSQRFVIKLRLAFSVVLVQTLLTAVAPFLRSELAFSTWIVFASLALGIGVPTTFSMTVDLIPRRDRGYAAALVTAGAYWAANVLPQNWSIEHLAVLFLILMPPGVLGLGLLAFRRFRFVEQLAEQHLCPEFRFGRFVRQQVQAERSLSPTTARTHLLHFPTRLIVFIILMFGVYFVDSLGFLRLVATPAYAASAWQSPELSPRLLIAVVHVLTALSGGILYSTIEIKRLFLWIFGIFGLVHLMYTMDLRISPAPSTPLSMPMLYATAVSLYTVVSMALWADISTPETISVHAALGAALSGWTATFLSTALALQWRIGGMPLEQHLQLVDALAILFFLAVLVLYLLPARHTQKASLVRMTTKRRQNKSLEGETQ